MSSTCQVLTPLPEEQARHTHAVSHANHLLERQAAHRHSGGTSKNKMKLRVVPIFHLQFQRAALWFHQVNTTEMLLGPRACLHVGNALTFVLGLQLIKCISRKCRLSPRVVPRGWVGSYTGRQDNVPTSRSSIAKSLLSCEVLGIRTWHLWGPLLFLPSFIYIENI